MTTTAVGNRRLLKMATLVEAMAAIMDEGGHFDVAEFFALTPEQEAALDAIGDPAESVIAAREIATFARNLVAERS